MAGAGKRSPKVESRRAAFDRRVDELQAAVVESLKAIKKAADDSRKEDRMLIVRAP